MRLCTDWEARLVWKNSCCSITALKVAASAGDLACERYVLSKGKLQIEVLNNLDRVAPVGALLFAAWPNIEEATGLPVRVLAITPKIDNIRP